MTEIKDITTDALIALITKGATDKAIFDELMSRNMAEAKAAEARKAQIATIAKSIKDQGITLSMLMEEKAYSPEDVKFVARELNLIPKGKGKGKGTTGGTTSKKTGEVLIEATTASGRGGKATYNKGQPLPQNVQKAFKELFETSGNKFEEELAKCFTEAGKAYFVKSNQAAMDELKGFINFVKTGKVYVKPATEKAA